MVRKRPRGRPALPNGQDKSAVLRVRVRPGDMARIEAAAKAAGMTVPDLVRDAVLGSLENTGKGGALGIRTRRVGL